ncbi:hypothetical protein [Sulfitobacter pontiacus]|uniref:hypothetical protein n=1 Tax=Sulfitobacter pontiacus TaxID=60137 RepID=UPI0030ED591A
MGKVPTGTRELLNKTESSRPILRLRKAMGGGHKGKDVSVRYYTDMIELNDLVETLTDHTLELLTDSNSGALDLHLSDKKCGQFAKITATSGTPVLLNNLTSRSVIINSNKVSIANSDIFNLNVVLSEGSITLKNCTVGVLNLKHSKAGQDVERISLNDCKILSLLLPREIKARDVEIKNVEFVSTYENVTEELSVDPLPQPTLDRASFGFLHDWAVKAGNSEIAHLARGNELAIERRIATKGLERFILSLWYIFGNFGLSPMRPIIWMFAAMIAMCAILFCTGTSLSIPADELVGWRHALQDTEDYSGALARAAAGTLEGGVSPLSVFSSRRMIIPNSEWIAGLQVLYGYFCIAMFLLFGFSVRRRFKIS